MSLLHPSRDVPGTEPDAMGVPVRGCVRCGMEGNPEDLFCRECGCALLRSTTLGTNCPHCHRDTPLGAFCFHCAQSLL